MNAFTDARIQFNDVCFVELTENYWTLDHVQCQMRKQNTRNEYRGCGKNLNILYIFALNSQVSTSIVMVTALRVTALVRVTISINV